MLLTCPQHMGGFMARIRSSRADYAQFKQMTTRWRDNDMYGHMNNVVFYEYVDTAVNMWLIENADLDIPNGEVVGLVAETSCTFHGPLGFPEPLDVGCGFRGSATHRLPSRLACLMWMTQMPLPRHASPTSM